MNRAFLLHLSWVLLIGFSVLSAPLTAQDNCAVSGGRLITANGTPYVPVCIDDMTEEVTVIERDDFVGGNSIYFMTTAAGFIVQVMEGSPPYDFSEVGAGVRAIWSVSYTGELTNAGIGDNICASGSSGCFNLSNPVVLNRATGEDCDVFCRADAGVISFTDGRVDTNICLISGVTEPLAIDVSVAANAQNVNYLVTSDQGRILDIISGEGPFDFSGQGAGTSLIWQLAYADELQGLSVGNTAEDFRGCYSLSNPLTVTREAVTAGSIFISDADGGGTAITICAADGQPDGFGIDLYPGSGDNERWVITDANGNIVALPQDPPPYNLESAGVGRCRIYHLTFADGLTGLRPLRNIADLSGCYELSNPIVVTRRSGASCPDEAVARLSGNHLSPCALTTSGYGEFNASLDGNLLSVTGSFSGLPSDFNPNVGGGLQLHLGYAGQEGAFILPLTPRLDPDGRGGLLLVADNQLGLTDAQAAMYRDRGMYVTLHTEELPTGALRGQFLPANRRYKYATLSGAYLVPAEATEAGGGIALERLGNRITLSGSFDNLTGKLRSDTSGTIFLNGAATGRNGKPYFRLKYEPSTDSLSAVLLPDSNTFVFTPGLIDSLDRNLLYVSVHTDYAPDGELRGQLTDMSVANFHADLSGQQVRPEPINTGGNGRLVLAFNSDSTLTLSGSIGNLDGPVSGTGLHLGLAGSVGPPIFELNLTSDAEGGVWLPADNTFPLSPGLVRQLYGRELYVSVRTATNDDGEVRGQVLHLAAAYFGANLTGGNENPEHVDTEAKGYLVFERCGDELTASGSFSGLESNFNAAVAGGASLHLGAAHVTGNAVLPLVAEIKPDCRSGVFRGKVNRMPFPWAGQNALSRSEIYANVYSLEHPEGEIRGQVLGTQNAFPTPARITSPRNGRNFLVREDGTTQQRGRFQPGTDPDGDLVVHTIEFTSSVDPNFDEPLVREKIGDGSSSTRAIQALHDTLRNQGFTTGMTAALRYRILASDGSVTVAGLPEIFTLVFGEVPDLCSVEGGFLTLAGREDTEIEFCTADGLADNFSVDLSGNEGSRLTYVVTDGEGTILRLTTEENFQFEGTGSGLSLIYALSHEAGLLGLAPGLKVADLTGCFALSNPIRIVRLPAEDCEDAPCTAEGGTLIVSGSDQGTDVTLCAGDGEDDTFTV
ncbi:MAG: CHRD domain-containing protein, partial [Bacteroidota bacterium]